MPFVDSITNRKARNISRNEATVREYDLPFRVPFTLAVRDVDGHVLAVLNVTIRVPAIVARLLGATSAVPSSTVIVIVSVSVRLLMEKIRNRLRDLLDDHSEIFGFDHAGRRRTVRIRSRSGGLCACDRRSTRSAMKNESSSGVDLGQCVGVVGEMIGKLEL